MVDYSSIVTQLKKEHRIRIRRWRRAMSGCAWRVYHADGRVINWVESPVPRTPISLAIFLHEVGHHVIGFDRYPDQCVEELRAWQWAIGRMKRLGIQPDARVMRRYDRSMRYAVEKALRRGMRPMPRSLQAWLPAA